MPVNSHWTQARPTDNCICHGGTGRPPWRETLSHTAIALSALTACPRCFARRPCLGVPTTGRSNGPERAPPLGSPTRASRRRATVTPPALATTANPGASSARTPATPPATAKTRWKSMRPTPPASESSWTTLEGLCPSTMCQSQCHSSISSMPLSVNPFTLDSGSGMNQQ